MVSYPKPRFAGGNFVSNEEREQLERLLNASKAEDAEIMKCKHDAMNFLLGVRMHRNTELRGRATKNGFTQVSPNGKMYRVIPVEPLHITLDREFLEMNYLYFNTGTYDG